MSPLRARQRRLDKHASRSRRAACPEFNDLGRLFCARGDARRSTADAAASRARASPNRASNPSSCRGDYSEFVPRKTRLDLSKTTQDLEFAVLVGTAGA